MSTDQLEQAVLSLVLQDKAALYRAYMSYLKSGGIFVPTNQRFDLGEAVTVLLTLPESGESQSHDPLPVSGHVVWSTPAAAMGNRIAGIGVQFAETSEGEQVKDKIESLLAGALDAQQPTHTM